VPRVFEVSFVRRSGHRFGKKAAAMPTAIDWPNNSAEADLVFRLS